MIKVGTSCWIIYSTNGYAVGDVVTVLSPLQMRLDGIRRHQVSRPASSCDRADAEFFWRPAWLLPINDPDQTDEVRRDEELTA